MMRFTNTRKRPHYSSSCRRDSHEYDYKKVIRLVKHRLNNDDEHEEDESDDDASNLDSDSNDELTYADKIRLTTAAAKPTDGPKYEINPESVTLYKAKSKLQRWHWRDNTNGFVPVVVDPDLAEQLKQDQIDGVKFMFNNFNAGKGCILAHEVGVGKTLTCITLIHTLLEQSIGSRCRSRPSISNVVIVTVKHLMGVWETEFNKWLDFYGPKLVKTSCKGDQDAQTIQDFLSGRSKAKILIMSYETIKKHARFFRLKQPLDLIIFDELHKLKNSKSQRSQACQSLSFRVKIGLTGTPVQNSLEELCHLIDIVQPGTLLCGTDTSKEEFDEEYLKRFSTGNLIKRKYRLNSKDHRKLKLLKKVISPILHIRTNKVAVNKHEFILCGRLEPFQDKLYRNVASAIQDSINSNNNNTSSKLCCSAITLLRNICHHPVLARRTISRSESAMLRSLYKATIRNTFNDDERITAELGTAHEPFMAQKVKFIFVLLNELRVKHQIGRATRGARIQDKERVVIISYSTQVLGMIGKMLKENEFKYLELIGDTREKKRSSNIAKFNNARFDYDVFLLSSKAGGVGIGLTGANHLVLLDPDWNPANDEQAMGRIWREGQKKPCYIYRLFSTGTIEEVMYKRQLSKKELDRYISEPDFRNFEILREARQELYAYKSRTTSSIHDSINCTKKKCVGSNSFSSSWNSVAKLHYTLADFAHDVDDDEDDSEEFDADEEEYDIGSLSKWDHFESPDQLPVGGDGDDNLAILRKIWSYQGKLDVGLTFAFYKKTDSSRRKVMKSVSRLIDLMTLG